MRLRHHVPRAAFRSDPVTAEYQAEVDASTAKAQVAYERAQRRLEAAERRLAKARETADRRASNARKAREVEREIRIAAELVEIRREELQRIEALMKGVPASVGHRGKGAYRPVPQPGRQV